MRAHFGDWTVDSDRRELRRGSRAVHLSPKAFKLLESLIEQRPKALAKRELYDRLWPDTFVTEGNLSSLVKELRIALGDDARHPQIIRTVFGFGYAFAAEAVVERTEARSFDSVAVLPFGNETRDPEWDYLADGIAESLINALARIRELRVIPRSSAFRHRGRTDFAHVARELRIDAIVTGGVARYGDAFSVHAELIDGRSEAQVWGDRIRRSGGDLLTLQSGIATEIAERLQSRLTLDDRATVGHRPTPSSDAYHHYLKGRHHWSRRTADGIRRAIESFRAAIAVDPRFALAHAALSETFVVLGTREIVPSREAFPVAREAAAAALEIDGMLASPHSSLASVEELFEWRWLDAERNHRRAVALDDRYGTSLQWLALHFARRGRHAEAKTWIERALELEPLSAIINTNAALVAYLARDYDRAIAQAGATLDLEPHFEGAWLIRGITRIQTGPISGAIADLEEAVRLSGGQHYTLANLAFAYAVAGRFDEAQRICAQLADASHVALARLGLKEHEAAFEALQRAARDRSAWLSYLRTEPRFDAIRADARYERLVGKIFGDA